jgi:hypothetical protein
MMIVGLCAALGLRTGRDCFSKMLSHWDFRTSLGKGGVA